MQRKDFEIMAPVGSYESLAAAIEAGADAVYFGVEGLNMRSRSSANFTLDDLAEIVRRCHQEQVKITDVIHNVSDKLAIAVNAVQQLMRNNTSQNEAAVTVADSFEKITESTRSADEQSRMLEEVVASLAGANAGIIEGIQTISAAMEEVTAHSSETYNISDKNTGIVNQVTELVESLNRQAQSLQSSV